MKEAKYIRPHPVCFHVYDFLGKAKLEIRPVFARGWRWGGEENECKEELGNFSIKSSIS